MTAEEKRLLIYKRLKENLNPEHLKVEDNSEQHRGHAGFGGGGRHFSITIRSASLNGLSRVAAHRTIYALFEDLIPDEIHALRIIIQ